MKSNLWQPGCATNTQSGKTGRSLIMLDGAPKFPGVDLSWKNKYGRGTGTSTPKMRGSISKAGKMTKKGKKLVGHGKHLSLMQFAPKVGNSSFKISGETSQALLLKKFKDLNDYLKDPWEAMKRVEERYPHLLPRQKCGVEGPIASIEVGACYSWRAELRLVGLHRRHQSGIDYKKIVRENVETTAAISVVVSGGYEDDVDEGETIIYTGEGGNDKKGSRKQCGDQKLQGGNLAMVNSHTLGIPVRVIRGRPDSLSPSQTSYSYDGMYRVAGWTQEPGISNFLVFKFRLVREPGQNPSTWERL